MRVENCECGVAFAGAEPRKIWLSTNQSPSIPPGGEPEATEHGCPIAARHDGVTGGVAEHLITPAAAWGITHCASVAPRAGVAMTKIPTIASHARGHPAPHLFYATNDPRRSLCFLKYGCDCEIMSPSAAIRKVTANAACICRLLDVRVTNSVHFRNLLHGLSVNYHTSVVCLVMLC